MKLDVIAAAIEAVYYAGRPKSSKKMDRRDFRVLAQMAHGSIMRRLYFQFVEDNNVFLYFQDQIETKTFDVPDADANGRRIFDLEANRDVLRLPNGLGIFSIMMVGNLPADQRRFNPAEVGSEWLYCGQDFEGTKIYIKKGRKIYLYGMPRDAKKVEMDGIFNDDNIEIPDDIAFDVVNAVLSTTLPTVGFPVDKTDDGNPNVTTVRKALAEPTSI